LPSGNFADQAQAIVQAIANGELTPSAGNELLAAISHWLKIEEFQNLNDRVAALEAQK
jgi:hypothetical protein